MKGKWWTEECDTWAKRNVKRHIGEQIMKFLSIYHQYVSGTVIDCQVAQDAALLYWTEEITRQCAEIFEEEIPGYAQR